MREFNYYYWGPLLYKSKVADTFVDQIYTEAKKLTSKDLTRNTLAGAIEREYSFGEEYSELMFNMLGPYFQHYIKFCVDDWAVGRVTEETVYKIEKEKTFWVNFQQKMEYNPRHCHEGDISFVLYLDIPEVLRYEYDERRSLQPGRIGFYHSHYHNPYGTIFDPISEKIVMPEKGDLFIFPSYLEHEVASFKSDVIRVSVSGNLIVKSTPSQ